MYKNEGFCRANSSYLLLQKQNPQMAAIHCFSLHPIKTLEFSPQKFSPLILRPQLASIPTSLFSSATSIPCLASNNSAIFKRLIRVPCNCLSTVSPNTTHYEVLLFESLNLFGLCLFGCSIG